MEFLDLGARSPCDYTFNFWNDYLGLSTLVAPAKSSSPPCSPNSITRSLKATLGLEDESPGSPPVSFHHLNEHISLLRPYGHFAGDSPLGGRESPPHGGSLAGLDLLSEDRRRKQSPRGKPEPKVCVFCRNNGAPEEVFGTHILKRADGRVLCPILRAYTCPLCSAHGDHAHTIKYCPLSRDQATQRMGRGGRVLGKRLKVF